jgi:protein-tyrosine phosphatase
MIARIHDIGRRCRIVEARMDFLTEMVAVGCADDARDVDVLRERIIGAVLSLVPLGPPQLHLPNAVVEVADKQALPSDAIQMALHFVRSHVRAGRRVLVHCQSGISRSPALAVCYLHQYEGWSIDGAVARVKTLRPQAEPHPALIESIRAHYVLR